MAFKDHFSSISENYAKYRPSYPDALFDFILSKLSNRDLAWDCATGNGQAAIKLAPHFDRVIATDASSEQIRNAQKIDNVEYVVSEAESSPLENRSCDLITVAQAVHWFDFEKFNSEVNRVLKADGWVAIWSYGLFRLERDPLHRIISKFCYEEVGAYWPKERIYIDKGYSNIPFPFKEITTPSLFIDISFTLEQLMNYMATWSALKNYNELHEEDPLISLKEKLYEYWPGDEPLKAQFPLHLRMGQL